MYQCSSVHVHASYCSDQLREHDALWSGGSTRTVSMATSSPLRCLRAFDNAFLESCHDNRRPENKTTPPDHYAAGSRCPRCYTDRCVDAGMTSLIIPFRILKCLLMLRFTYHRYHRTPATGFEGHRGAARRHVLWRLSSWTHDAFGVLRAAHGLLPHRKASSCPAVCQYRDRGRAVAERERRLREIRALCPLPASVRRLGRGQQLHLGASMVGREATL